MDVSRLATDFVIIQTLPPGGQLLQINIYSDANMNNNQINIYEKQKFMAVVMDAYGNKISDLSQYTYLWTITDSNGRSFVSYSQNLGSLTISYNQLLPYSIYTVCI